jgi:uncharacterized coiled-coil protein SlyX
MTDNHLQEKIAALEVRLMHLEASLDEVTRALLKQEQQLSLQAEIIRRLEARIRDLSDAGSAETRREPPPPHY